MKQRIKDELARRGVQIRRLSEEERLLSAGYDPRTPLPAGAEAALRPDNPRLVELERRYQTFQSPVALHTQWRTELDTDVADLHYFRGDNAYLWGYTRVPQINQLKYFLYARYLRDRDNRGLLGDVLSEDGGFGCLTFSYEEMPTVSRDLLDSVNELQFLDRHWKLFDRGPVSVLDIGAGYGRLADRMLKAVPGVERYWCIDAIPRSTFLCEYYLQHRLGPEDQRAVVVPVDEMRSAIEPGAVDLAVNIHSFSEMGRAAVEGWLSWLERLEVPWLLVVPNEADKVLSREADGSRRDCADLLDRASYQLTVSEPTITDIGVRSLFGINDSFLLFERASRG